MINKKIHLNSAQIRSTIISAPYEILVAGRATGKTVGPLAIKSCNKYFGTMPRGTGAIINATYTQAYTRTLKELIRGWQMYGMIFDHHFVVGRRPSEKWIKKWSWKGPYAMPLDFKHFVCWNNGAVGQLLSQDRVGGANGISIDWIIGDEIKLLNEDKLKADLFPANRGIVPEFSGNPYHHGYTFTTDMPIGSSGQWIFDFAKSMDPAAIDKIWKLNQTIFKLKSMHKKATSTTRIRLDEMIDAFQEQLKLSRKGVLYYHEATTLDNIHALGVDFIKQQIRDTSKFMFDTQILNIRPMRMEDGFYPDFDEDVHGYFSEEETYFDNATIDYLNPTLTCAKDKDLVADLPLHISIDYNRRIHPMVVAQVTDEITVLNGLHALFPGKLKEVVQLFVDYYKPHKRKLVYYWYDHTAVGDDNDTMKSQDVVKQLRQSGWIVKEMYTAKAPGHETKYRMYGHLFSNDGYYNKTIRFNRENCRYLITSILKAEAEQRKDGFGKDKRPEKDSKVPAEEATHYSDALDMLVFGLLESRLNYTSKPSVGGILIG